MEQIQTPTFAATDNFQLQKFAKQLEAFLGTEHAFVEGSLVVSLNAGFGAGKTTFLRMWANDLLERRKGDPKLPTPIILNAWEDDHCGDSLLAMISAITKALASNSAPKEVSKIREAASDVANFSLGLANQFVAGVFGVDPVAAGEYAEKKKNDRYQSKQAHVDLLAVFERRSEALSRLKSALAELVGGENPKVLILVDELDRCRPDYAVHYLETIKHIFDIPGLIFVLAVDKAQLSCSAKALFGTDLNFDEYYRKFAHRNIQLPKPSIEGLRALAEKYVTRYLKMEEGGRYCMLAVERHYIEGIIEFAIASELKPRQVQELFRILGHIFAGRESSKGKLLWGYGVGTILLVVLSMTNPYLYHSIGAQKATSEDVGEYLKQVVSKPAWWLQIFSTGYVPLNTNENTTTVYDSFRNLNLLDGDMNVEKFQRSLAQFVNGWGDNFWHTPPVVLIYNNIEELKTFAGEK